ncbi:GNAT family N-acetyltransferase [Staphylococcus lutrae]|uniref:GNAT family N-acetyltransferase n=1 Tax=Staphylococcus lutrae TaxID=155085 RepID=A0AAC9RWC6_9STAP|nr:N-acetyltransferase [Staphylococcus lutrae]ARJ52000.1 GNAT family N-acetyltransferase [Staphylococcus lutrae]PNZ37167.1 N-acetyltransferase [Staphylococcus lutrae]
MSIFLSTPTENDYDATYEMIANVFAEQPESNHQEHCLVKRLRLSPNYHYELEVVAKTEDGRIIGHAMCSEVRIQNETTTYVALALNSLVVSTSFRHKGIGKALVHALEERALSEEYTTIVAHGHGDFYEQLDYEQASHHHIVTPLDIPPENFYVKFLWDSLEDPPNGKVIYPEVFFE